MPGDHHFHLDVASRFENIELIQVVLRDSLERLGIDDDTCHWMDVAVREAVANAIKHGNAQDPAKQVHVDLYLEDEELIIQVEDEGMGFQPDDLRNPLAPENLLKPNGRGIFYMNSFMDKIEYNPRPGGGTIVTLRKKVAGPEPGH